MTHQIFAISDLCLSVAESIFDPLDLFDDVPSHGSTLAALARVSQIFHDPATTVLWRELNDLSPLLCLLPSRLFVGIESWEYVGQSPETLEEDIDSKTRDRFLWHAQKVRSIRHKGSSLSASVIKILAGLGSPAPTFPFLAATSCTPHSPDALAAMHTLWSSPSLHSLDIYIQHHLLQDTKAMAAFAHHLGHVLRSMPQSVPGLRYFSLYLGNHNGVHSLALCPILALALPSLRQLHFLSLLGFRYPLSVMSSVSSLPHLNYLNISLDDNANSAPKFGPEDFPSLTFLCITAEIPLCVTVMTSLQVITSLNLKHLTLGPFNETDTSTTLQLTRLISDKFSKTLQTISIGSYHRLDPSVLEPLFLCRQIRSANIPVSADSKEQADEIMSAAKAAWPCIDGLGGLGLHRLKWD